ncbi:DUF1738 domain-containing protein [Candidatus Symbiopectobacterium sp. NZEC151]|nr:DUF1738 domain-containing protein [Candidatus Symbiopectobacterium sp. NZEC151]
MKTSLHTRTSAPNTATATSVSPLDPSGPSNTKWSQTQTDICQTVTNNIIAALEAGVKPWTCPWQRVPGMSDLPANFATGIAYSGINIMLLWCSASKQGFSDPRWMTYKQAQAVGGQVRRGEHGTTGIFYTTVEKENKEGDIEHFPMLKTFVVFNVEQIDCLSQDVAPAQPAETFAPLSRVEALFHHTGATITEKGQNAFYRPSTDEIWLPERRLFADAASFYATGLHELVHWTGAKSRLNRDMKGRFGSEDYAFEELIVRRRGANTGVDMIILDSWENPCEPDLPVPVMNWLKSQKGNGTIACQEKAQTAEAIVGRAGHRKMRMVKAKLPEPQSSEFYPQQRRSGGCNVVPCRYRDAIRPGLKKMVRLNIFGPASTVCPLSGGSKGRTGHLSASYLHIRVTTGSPKWARVLRPTWRQSCHSSQMPEVMLRTAISGWMIGNERFRVTGPGVSADQVKGSSVCDSGLPTEGVC